MSEPRTHPLKWVDCSRKGCTHTLGDALGIDRTRSAETDAIVNALVEQNESLRGIVTALSERSMTDAEFATALYALGWFDRGMRG